MATLSTVLHGLGHFDLQTAQGILSRAGGQSLEIPSHPGIDWTHSANLAAHEVGLLEEAARGRPVDELEQVVRVAHTSGETLPAWLAGQADGKRRFARTELHNLIGVPAASALIDLTRIVTKAEPEIVKVPAGNFLMGPGTRRPMAVRMTTPLRVGVTPVRDDQYHRFAIVTGILPDRPRSREIHGEESLAANVTYEQAVLYADRFARLTDRMRDDGTPRVRLLADFERERAERGRPVDLRGIARHGADPASVLPSLWGTMLEHGFSGEDPEAALATGATLVSDSAEVVRLLQEGQAVWAFGVYGTENGQPPPSRDPDPFRSVRSPLPARSVGPNDFGLWDLSGQLREWVTVTRDSQTRPALKGGWVGDHLQGAGDEQTGFGKNFTDIDVGFRLAIEED